MAIKLVAIFTRADYYFKNSIDQISEKLMSSVVSIEKKNTNVQNKMQTQKHTAKTTTD